LLTPRSARLRRLRLFFFHYAFAVGAMPLFFDGHIAMLDAIIVYYYTLFD